jgi:hypothetical protein
MASAESIPNDVSIPGAMPERWETAVEDFAQLVALGLDRAQDLADVIGELNRTRPGLTRTITAAVGGAVVGMFVAGILPRRRPSRRERAKRAAATVRRAASERVSAIEQAAAVAQAAAQRLADRAPSPSELRDRLPRIDRSEMQNRASGVQARARRRFSPPEVGMGQIGNAAKLFPIILALLRNPLVRALLWRSAARMARRG